MASLTIRNFDNNLKAQLRQQAARHGRSMEAEARSILSQTLNPPSSLSSPNIHESGSVERLLVCEIMRITILS
jgi:plasmid stability protein